MSKQTENYSALAASMGLRYDSANDVLCGKKDDFDLVIYPADKQYPYMLSVHTAAKSPSGTAISKAEFKELTRGVKPIRACVQSGSNFTVNIVNQPNQEKLKASLAESVNGLLSFLRSRGYSPCCSICGQSAEVAAYRSGGKIFHLCEECGAKMQGDMARLVRQKDQKKENVVGGVVGALLGSLLGVLCIILLSQVGYVAALSGVIMAVGVLKGYELLGGKLTKKGVVISVVIMLFMTYFGDRMDWAIALFKDGGFGDAGFDVFDCFRIVPDVIREADYVSSYVVNLLLLYVFLLLGAVPTIRSRVTEEQEQGKMVRLGQAQEFGGYVQ